MYVIHENKNTQSELSMESEIGIKSDTKLLDKANKIEKRGEKKGPQKVKMKIDQRTTDRHNFVPSLLSLSFCFLDFVHFSFQLTKVLTLLTTRTVTTWANPYSISSLST